MPTASDHPEDSPQRRALRHVAARAVGGPVDPTLPLTLNFHPDRPVAGRPILRRMAEDGVYVSQFVTGTSNGGLTAHPGGDRWRWESRMFGAAYDRAPARQRPVYGGLNHLRRSVGAAPRFGSAHFRLAPEVLPRTTFCYPDSSAESTTFGVADRCDLVRLALAEGRPALDGHIEAQVHGPVTLATDVRALVLDPCYRGTAVAEAAAALPCPVEWHPGYRLATAELRRHPGFRGPEIVALGCAIAERGWLDPRIIGEAACAGRYDGQALKRLWHCLVAFGAPDA
ncbi:DUF3626 domain-containing protein [Streptomyces sp. DSM 44915]|uniref:DUF3626 domain-containing protein n=1 Tax=Streptomyces chisholmiae TaxID=3075540 RepID=A0ABU2JRI3_9ACTN|nr:DUF3626 domain-containing protein [Streptomyces sp. DSM 44915]MDT0267575.1 DUF3626 domain-containing protein [Streptomyces sp. DSM 44915]